MRVKRYVATNIEEAMAKIKLDLGTNAVILHTRYFKEGGFLGLFRQKYVEVTAATDHNGPGLETKVSPKQFEQLTSEPVSNPYEKLAQQIPAASNIIKDCPQDSDSGRYQTREPDLAYDLKEMKSLMDDMTKLIEESSNVSHFPKVGQSLFLRLKRHEVEDKIAKKIVRATLQQFALNPSVSEEQLDNVYMANILKQLKKAKPFKLKGAGTRTPHTFALIGPTGVGKTTTIAKLAAMYAIMERKKVALLTVDTYRIAAVEQLKTIAEIMEVPIKVVYSVAQMRDAIMEFNDKDVIFIDTAGRSHKNALQIEELKIYLETAEPNEIFLVLAGTSKYNDLLDIMAAYSDFNISRLIFTKLDETSSYGPIYNLACKSKVPIAYFTNGQNIPDDIEAAEPLKLVQLMMKE